MGGKKILTGTYNLYVKQGYKFSLSCCNSHDRLVDNIDIRHDRRVNSLGLQDKVDPIDDNVSQ